jgi:hypothetical protein
VNIPDKAVKAGEWAVTNYVIAADEREYQGSQEITQEELRRVYLEAAAPLIAAQERRETARLFREKAKAIQEIPGYSLTLYHISVATLLDLADVLDRDADELEGK